MSRKCWGRRLPLVARGWRGVWSQGLRTSITWPEQSENQTENDQSDDQTLGLVVGGVLEASLDVQRTRRKRSRWSWNIHQY